MNANKTKDRVRQVPLDLPVDFVMTLDAFCEAHHGATRKRIIHDAVTAMIERELTESTSLKARFETVLAERKRSALNIVPINPKA